METAETSGVILDPAEHAPETNGYSNYSHRLPELEVNSLLEQRMKDWGESREVSQEQLEWFQENAMSLVEKSSGANGQNTLTTALFDLFAALLNPPVKAPAKFLIRCYLWRCEMPLADALINYESPANWWRGLGVSKQMCFKLANQFCDFLKLPRRSNQRDLKSRQKMSRKRLEPKNNKHEKRQTNGNIIAGRRR